MKRYHDTSSSFVGVYIVFSLSLFSLALIFGSQGQSLFLTPSSVLGVSTEKTINTRVATLENFLEKQRSPLASKAAEMVAAADKYQFDWRLLPAIAGKESSFGKKIPWNKEEQKSSYNAWGWGIYGDKTLNFSSFEEAVEKIAEGLQNEYFDKGYITIDTMMNKFAPSSNGSWARDVKAIMEQIISEEKQNVSKK